jgi:WXG100 family type VII secretion target
MGEEILVNHGKMGSIADVLMKGVSEMDRELDELERHILGLQENFTGQAADAYNRAQAKWNQSIKELALALDRGSKFVNEAQSRMHEADMRGAGGFGG